MLSYFIKSVLSIFTVMSVILSSTINHSYNLENILDSDVFLLEEDVSRASSGSTTVNVLKISTDSAFEISKAFELYDDEMNGDIKLSLQTVNETDYFFTLRSKLISGEEIDLFTISNRSELNSLKDFVKDLSSHGWIRQAQADTLSAVRQGDMILGVPYSMEATGLICNQEIFDYADIPIIDIRDIEELNDALAKLNKKIVSGELSEKFPDLEAVTEFPALDKNFLEKQFADIVLSTTFKSAEEAASAENLLIAEQEPAEEILKLLMRYSLSRNDWEKSMRVTDSMQLESFARYRTAVILQNTGAYRQLLNINPAIQGNASLLPVPLADFETPVVYVGVPFYWAANLKSGEKTGNAAIDFLKWLYLSDTGAQYLAKEMEEASPFLESAQDTGFVLHRQMINYLRADMYLPQIHSGFPSNWGKGAFAMNVQNYITERAFTWQDVIKGCEDAWSDEGG